MSTTTENRQKETTVEWTRRHLLGLEDLSADEIITILDTAETFKEVSTRSVKKTPALRGKVVALLFFEPSTRTANSFQLAATRLSADVVMVNKQASSATKGETLRDTARNIEAMGIDIVVVRHSAPGAAKMLSEFLDCSVINAGDGAHEHPTQALLDIFTIREHKGRLDGLKVGIVGDISHSRVARSNIWGLRKLGAEVVAIGPSTMVPSRIADLGATVSHHLEEVIGELDVINMLRIQNERLDGQCFPSVREYTRLFGLNAQRMRLAKPDVLIMHPGPINRGVEITPEVADGPQSVILKQVSNGLAVRMAVMYLVSARGVTESKK